MKQIDAHTVELNDDELRAHEFFVAYLDRGLGLPFSAKLALNRTEKERAVTFTGLFVHHLSDGTCERFGNRVAIQQGWRETAMPMTAQVRIGYHRVSDNSIMTGVWEPTRGRSDFVSELMADDDVDHAWWRVVNQSPFGYGPTHTFKFDGEGEE